MINGSNDQERSLLVLWPRGWKLAGSLWMGCSHLSHTCGRTASVTNQFQHGSSWLSAPSHHFDFEASFSHVAPRYTAPRHVTDWCRVQKYSFRVHKSVMFLKDSSRLMKVQYFLRGQLSVSRTSTDKGGVFDSLTRTQWVTFPKYPRRITQHIEVMIHYSKRISPDRWGDSETQNWHSYRERLEKLPKVQMLVTQHTVEESPREASCIRFFENMHRTWYPGVQRQISAVWLKYETDPSKVHIQEEWEKSEDCNRQCEPT